MGRPARARALAANSATSVDSLAEPCTIEYTS